MNPHTQVVPIQEALLPENASALLEPYDIILDCTDNAPTRYLLSDIAVALKKPLVSGAAQKFDGQLCTYNLGNEGPCYRCIFPVPPAPEMTGSCEEVGILGAVTGIIGNLQALEAIKIITGLHGVYLRLEIVTQVGLIVFADGKPSLLLYSALSVPPFRSVKLRQRRPTCKACGNEGQKEGPISQTDYVTLCGGPRPDWVARGLIEGTPENRIRAKVNAIMHNSVDTIS